MTTTSVINASESATASYSPKSSGKPDRRTRTFRVAKKLQAKKRDDSMEGQDYFIRNVMRFGRVMAGREPFKNRRISEQETA